MQLLNENPELDYAVIHSVFSMMVCLYWPCPCSPFCARRDRAMTTRLWNFEVRKSADSRRQKVIEQISREHGPLWLRNLLKHLAGWHDQNFGLFIGFETSLLLCLVSCSSIASELHSRKCQWVWIVVVSWACSGATDLIKNTSLVFSYNPKLIRMQYSFKQECALNCLIW